MKAIRFDAFGGPEVLRLTEVELPAPRPGEVRVRAGAIGVNFTDISLRSGLYPTALPSGVGLDAVGTIDAVGDGITTWRPGDRVAYSTGPAGAYAEANCVDAARLLAAPDDIADDVLACLLMKGLTSQYLLRQVFPVATGQRVLFHGAAGGLGQIACQWANALGATVIGTVGSDEKLAAAEAAGCALAVNNRTVDWVERVRSFAGGHGVDVVYDSIGKDTFDGSIAALKVRGHYVGFGAKSGPTPPIELGKMALRGSYFFTHAYGGHYNAPADAITAFAEVLEMVRSERITVRVDRRLPLSQAVEAHRALESRQNVGSIVLIP